MPCTSANNFFAPHIAHLQASQNNVLLVTIVTNHAPDMLCSYISGSITQYSNGVMSGGGTQYFSDRVGPSPDQAQPFYASQPDSVGIEILPPSVIYLPGQVGGVGPGNVEEPGQINLILHSWGDQTQSFQIDGCDTLLTASSGTDFRLILSLREATEDSL